MNNYIQYSAPIPEIKYVKELEQQTLNTSLYCQFIENLETNSYLHTGLKIILVFLFV